MRIDQADVILSRGIASFPIHVGPRAPGRACGDRDVKPVLIRLPWLRAPGNGQKPGRTYVAVLAPAANDLAPAFVLSQAADLRLRGDPMRRSRCCTPPRQGVAEQRPAGTMLAGKGKERRLRSDNVRASSGHHDMGASVAPVPTVRLPAGPGVTKDDYSPYSFVIFPGPTPPATLSTAGRRRCRLLHKYING
jgi:hypothetical protein